uniref:Transposable element P transposase-like RNase H C-terminal domain-containing protein n=2 Tax=Ixodes scapularis TaxID=6945 RepID=A0A1S4KWE5_IXOSC
YILTHKISQDHLEIFFGSIRGKGGYNNNPTAWQFKAAYKRLLIQTEVKSSEAGNCSADV